MKTLLLIFISSFCIVSLNAQHLSELDSLQLSNFKRADIVVLGTVVEIDTIKLIAKLRVYEIFKGSPPKVITFKTTNGYSYIPIPGGLWIIYGIQEAENVYSISDQGLSRSNINPDKIWYYTLQPARTKQEIQEFENKRLHTKLRALAEWDNELYKLRNKLVDY